MTLSVIRSFTESDKERLDESALRFADRHALNLDLDDLPTVYEALDMHLWMYYPELKRLWQACKCRALKVPVSARIAVAYGYIGNSVN
jgi:acyl carrier protein phosphodiesterase